MADRSKARKIITDKLVIEKTGKTLEDWFVLLDAKGAGKISSGEIYMIVNKIRGLEPLGEWNRGLLATTYQWSRGIRERGEKENGFEISVSKTVNVPIGVLYTSFVDDKARKKWLQEKITIRKSTENKSARVTWSDNETSLSIDFYAKGENKSQVVVQHLKVNGAEEAQHLKNYWGQTLDHLKQILEK